jgi:hypothetical protein
MANIHKAFIALAFLFICSVEGSAQKPAGEEVGTYYRSEAAGGFIWHTNGVGIHFRYGRNTTDLYKTSFGLDLVNMRHDKEVKVYNPVYDDGKGYYFGKMNAVLVARPFYGGRKILFKKLRTQGVEVGFNWGIGPSIAFAKPVYLAIIKPNDPLLPVVDEKYDPSKHNVDNIYGRSRWSLGMDEMKIHIGAQAKFGMHFEIHPEDDRIRALEVGVSLDYYPKEIQIMAGDVNKPYFLTPYLNFIFGGKYY